MDFTKAFDTVSHEILMHKLYHYGIRGPAYGLIASYLSRTNQFVVVNNTLSSLKPINIGVPQGSILGPLLFLIYVNDICNATNCNPRLIADDACFVLSDISPKALELNCNAELQNLFSWCAANKLQVNPKKSFAIIIPPKINAASIDLNLRYENKTITCCKSSKYNGVTIDNKLKFKAHIRNIEGRIARSVGILTKLRYLFPSSALLLLYYALIHPHLSFSLPIWGSTYPTYIQKLQRLQNKAIRITSNVSRKNSATPLYKKYGVLKLADLFNHEMAKIMYQFSKQSLPSHLNCLFDPLSTAHERCTTSKTKQNLYIPKFSTSRCQNSFKYQGSKIWNSVTTDLKQQTFRKFKINYKNLLLESYH